MGADAKLRSGFLERIELREKFRLCQLPLRKAPFGLVVRVDEVLHVILLVRSISCIYTTSGELPPQLSFKSSLPPIQDRGVLRRSNKLIQAGVDAEPILVAQLATQGVLSLLPMRQCL